MPKTATRAPSRNLQWTFLVHAVVAVVMGLPLLLVPEAWGALVNWRAVDPTVTRLLGAAVVAIAVASWLGYRADSREELRILVAFEVVFPAISGLAALYEVLLADGPTFTWVFVAITVVFTVAFAYFYRQMAAGTTAAEGAAA
ncbi:MAG: hypothetical protein ABEJ23_10580 [Haloarculaceae archaeon]